VALVLVMTVNPGFGGQRLIPEALQKAKELRRMLDARGLHACSIEVDGGVNMDTLVSVLEAGADTLVMGSAIFGNALGIQGAMAAFREAVHNAKRSSSLKDDDLSMQDSF
jgi:ribulose-phosphate 3-epimerase